MPGVQGRDRIPTMDRFMTDRRLEAVRRVLGAERVDAAWTEGCAMSVDAAIAYVRQQLSA